ncbi:hypothetical protein LEP1GSC171_1722 [Leptospira santarosai str. HAI1380]|nr:hypothetical protein LEP1GSC171_1722 [Leptospira santarosai str. HAI1380]
MFYPLQDSDFLSFQNTFDLFSHTFSTFSTSARLSQNTDVFYGNHSRK